jgi:hypothetical protein
MKSYDFLTEGIVEDAHEMHQDHEVQMARKDCYQAAEHAIALHKMLRHVSENQGLEGWVAAKITLAADYLNTVREYLEYELMSQNSEPMHMDQAPVSVEFPIAESRKIDESKMKDLDLDLKKPPVGMTDQAFKKKYEMTKAEAKSAFSAKKAVSEGQLSEASPTALQQHHTGHYVIHKDTGNRLGTIHAPTINRNSHVAIVNGPMGSDERLEFPSFADAHNHIKKTYGLSEDDNGQEINDPLDPNRMDNRNRSTKRNIQARLGYDERGDARVRAGQERSTHARNKPQLPENIGKKKPQADRYHIVAKDGKPASLASYDDRASAEKDRDDKHPGAEVRQVGPRGKVKGVTEMSAGSVATVVNPTPKNKAKVGTLFGGTYQREETDTPSKKRMFNKKS